MRWAVVSANKTWSHNLWPDWTARKATHARKTPSSHRFMWQGEERISKLINTKQHLKQSHPAEMLWTSLGSSSAAAHPARASPRQASLQPSVALLLFWLLCAYSTSNQDCKISLQYRTPLRHLCACKHAGNTYGTALRSRTWPLPCLVNEASYRFLSGVGAAVLYHALPRLI